MRFVPQRAFADACKQSILVYKRLSKKKVTYFTADGSFFH
ncbi:hypothetical protein B4098_3425 [Heyndrickxia coagulans]|uniref:Uncharacterized protein n=1 Tax=Heyndrickxia coagulans TaxID=1398 RepID=A0A150JYS2_HEYCO|nr:hypothetical protein B4098_3425 [Heyndrickxia coagulans]